MAYDTAAKELTIHDQAQPVEDQRERDCPFHGGGATGDSIASRSVRFAGADGVKDAESDRCSRKFNTRIQRFVVANSPSRMAKVTMISL